MEKSTRWVMNGRTYSNWYFCCHIALDCHFLFWWCKIWNLFILLCLQQPHLLNASCLLKASQVKTFEQQKNARWVRIPVSSPLCKLRKAWECSESRHLLIILSFRMVPIYLGLRLIGRLGCRPRNSNFLLFLKKNAYIYYLDCAAMSNKIAFYFIYASVLYLRDTIYTWKLRGRGWYRRLRCLLTSIRLDVKIAGYPRGYLHISWRF